jgi:N-carbamoyl-L-amino-acid hydrolase
MHILVRILIVAMVVGSAHAAENVAAVNPQRIEARIQALSKFGANAQGGVDRVAFSEADVAGREYISGLMKDAGLSVRIDAAGNLIGRREGSESGLPPILFGSHIDSVPAGGNYDGDVGVVGAIEVAQVLHEQGRSTRHPLEVVVFADEEGGTGGSKAMAGDISAQSWAVKSHSGKTVGEGVRFIGGDPARIGGATRKPGDIAAYLELHIEQGARLDQSGTDIGIVEGIVGIKWWDVTVQGTANHAGTTPMDQRQDALLSAAELIVATNRVAHSLEGNQVATVGRINVTPGAPNVIPGRVVMTLEVRDLSEAKIDQVFALIKDEAGKIAQARSTSITFEPPHVHLSPALSDPRVRTIIGNAANHWA